MEERDREDTERGSATSKKGALLFFDRLVHHAYRLALDGKSMRDTGRPPELVS